MAPRQLARQEERHVTQLHLASRFHRQRGYVFGLVCAHQRRDPRGDVVALLIEDVFSEQARQYRAPQFRLRAHPLRHRSFMRPLRKHPLPHIHLRHLCHSFLP